MKKKIIALLLCAMVLSTVGCSKQNIENAEYVTNKLNEGIESANTDMGHEVKQDDLDITVTMDLTKDKHEGTKLPSEDKTEEVKTEEKEDKKIDDGNAELTKLREELARSLAEHECSTFDLGFDATEFIENETKFYTAAFEYYNITFDSTKEEIAEAGTTAFLVLAFIMSPESSIYNYDENGHYTGEVRSYEEIRKEVFEALDKYESNNSDEEQSTDEVKEPNTPAEAIENGAKTALDNSNLSNDDFAAYDNTKVSGDQVISAMQRFEGYDVAIIVQTKELAYAYPDMAINYNALITSDGKFPSSANRPEIMLYGDTEAPNSYRVSTKNSVGIATEVSRTAVVVEFGKALDMYDGNPYYTAIFSNTNGLVDYNYDFRNTTELGNYCYILHSARYSSVLILNPDGDPIGIVFKEIYRDGWD